MSIKPPFFCTIHDSTPSCPPTRLKFLHFGETLFDFGQKSYKINQFTVSSAYIGVLDDIRHISKTEKAFKIILICTIVAPLFALLAKLIYRNVNNFAVTNVNIVDGFEKIQARQGSYFIFLVAYPLICQKLLQEKGGESISDRELTPLLTQLYSKLTFEAEAEARAVLATLNHTVSPAA